MEKFAKQNSLKYFKCSSLQNLGIKELFESMTLDIIESIDDENLHIRSESIKLGYINKDYFNKDMKNVVLINNSMLLNRGNEENRMNCCKI